MITQSLLTDSESEVITTTPLYGSISKLNEEGLPSDAVSSVSLRIDQLEVLVSRYFYVYISFILCGAFLYGYDLGNSSSFVVYVAEYMELTDSQQAWVLSMALLMAAFGCLLAGPVCDWVGRRHTVLLSCIMFLAGCIVTASSNDLLPLLIGRAMCGLADGLFLMNIPAFLAEVSPRGLRGRVVVMFDLALYVGLVMSRFMDLVIVYVSDPGEFGWRWMAISPIVFAGAMLIAFIYLPESPRHLARRMRMGEARFVLQQIYAGPNANAFANHDLSDITEELQHTRRQKNTNPHGGKKYSWTVYLAFTTPSTRRAMTVGIGILVLQQLCGLVALSAYLTKLCIMTGLTPDTAITASFLIQVFSNIPTILPCIYADKHGRRPWLLWSVALQTLALLGVALCFLGQYYTSPLVTISTPGDTSICAQQTNCEACTSTIGCGFCSVLIVNDSVCTMTSELHPQQSVSVPSCNGASTSHFFTTVSCPSDYGLVLLAMIWAFFLSCSLGNTSLPWVINSEIYPMWARNTCMSLGAFVNQLTGALIALYLLDVSNAIGRYGLFFVLTAFSLISLVFIWYKLPETRHETLEQADTVFEIHRYNSDSTAEVYVT